MTDIESMADALGGKINKPGGGFLSLCPAHDDHNPSLSLDLGGNGKILFNCLSGCSQNAVMEGLKGLGLWESGNKATEAEQEEAKTRTILHKKKIEEKTKKAAVVTRLVWGSSTPAKDDHQYLSGKKVKATATMREIELDALKKVIGYTPKCNGVELAPGRILVIPVKIDADISTIEMIDQNGLKSALAHGKKGGGYWSAQALPTDDGAGMTLAIGEGVSTVLSVREATGFQVVACLSCSNFDKVARLFRQRYPKAEIVILADLGNGQAKAEAAAVAIAGRLSVPIFGDDRPERATDFNDLHALRGLSAVKACIEAAIVPASLRNDVTDVTSVTANDGGACERNAIQKPDVTVPEHDRPCFRVIDDWGKLPGNVKMRPGVWSFGIKAGKDGVKDLTPHWICSPIHVEAVTFDGQENNFGRLLRIKNTLGRWRTWAMPMELLSGDGNDLRRELLSMGVEIDPKAKNDLANYIQSQHPKRHVHCALQVGWNGDSYVLPDAVIGEKAAEVIFQSGERGHDEHTTGGTLAGWQEGIAARAVGNPLLTLAVSASFAGPLLARTNSEGGGVHYQGDSSTGKSTLLDAACATWGGPNFKRSWRTTANGMEGAAALFNDCLLALDEISECDPREVGAIVYSLGNGRGKQRASRTGAARSVTRWRCFVLSSGERTIGTTMAEGGHRVKAGQSVRLLDIPAARKYGAFDDLHGESSGSAFSDSLKLAATTHHGHAGRAYLEKLTRDSRNFCELLERVKSLSGFSPKDGEGQEKRAAGRFALMALAGELATEYGLTGWTEGAAVEAAEIGFNAWRSLRGRGNDERRQIVEKLLGFIERHGDSRFSDASNGHADDSRVINRAGWYRNEDGHRVYLFTAEGMKEATQGFELKRALDVLQEVGVLIDPGTNGERARSLRLGERIVKVYTINTERLGGDDHGA